MLAVLHRSLYSDFNPRSLTGSDSCLMVNTHSPTSNFNPRSRTGSDRTAPSCILVAFPFQPTLPHGERPVQHPVQIFLVISTHAPRTGSDALVITPPEVSKISTHAPRTGSDQAFQATGRILNISTHASRTGSDGDNANTAAVSRHFNPRFPHGERPRSPYYPLFPQFYFNPRFPHGERPFETGS